MKNHINPICKQRLLMVIALQRVIRSIIGWAYRLMFLVWSTKRKLCRSTLHSASDFLPPFFLDVVSHSPHSPRNNSNRFAIYRSIYRNNEGNMRSLFARKNAPFVIRSRPIALLKNFSYHYKLAHFALFRF